MGQAPFFNDRSNLARQLALKNFTCFDCDQGLETLVLSMNVNGRMVVVLHPDDDSKKRCYRWHQKSLAPQGTVW